MQKLEWYVITVVNKVAHELLHGMMALKIYRPFVSREIHQMQRS